MLNTDWKVTVGGAEIDLVEIPTVTKEYELEFGVFVSDEAGIATTTAGLSPGDEVVVKWQDNIIFTGFVDQDIEFNSSKGIYRFNGIGFLAFNSKLLAGSTRNAAYYVGRFSRWQRFGTESVIRTWDDPNTGQNEERYEDLDYEYRIMPDSYVNLNDSLKIGYDEVYLFQSYRNGAGAFFSHENFYPEFEFDEARQAYKKIQNTGNLGAVEINDIVVELARQLGIGRWVINIDITYPEIPFSALIIEKKFSHIRWVQPGNIDRTFFIGINDKAQELEIGSVSNGLDYIEGHIIPHPTRFSDFKTAMAATVRQNNEGPSPKDIVFEDEGQSLFVIPDVDNDQVIFRREMAVVISGSYPAGGGHFRRFYSRFTQVYNYSVDYSNNLVTHEFPLIVTDKVDERLRVVQSLHYVDSPDGKYYSDQGYPRVRYSDTLDRFRFDFENESITGLLGNLAALTNSVVFYDGNPGTLNFINRDTAAGSHSIKSKVISIITHTIDQKDNELGEISKGFIDHEQYLKKLKDYYIDTYWSTKRTEWEVDVVLDEDTVQIGLHDNVTDTTNNIDGIVTRLEYFQDRITLNILEPNTNA